MNRDTATASWCCAFTAILVLFLPDSAVAAPATVAYQGYLTDALGAAVSDTVDVRARLYDATGTTLLYHEIHPNTNVNAGLFKLAIGGGTPVSGVFSPALFQGPLPAAELEIQINGETLLPRRQLQSSAYSQAAADAQLLEGRQSSDFVVRDDTGTQTISDGALVIDGAAGSIETVGDYRFAAPKTYLYAITADRFVERVASSFYLTDILYRYTNSTSGAIWAIAGYNLPAGARQTRLQCHFYDANIVGAITTLRAKSFSRLPGEPSSVVDYGTLFTDSLIPSSSSSVRTRSTALSGVPIAAGTALQIELIWQVSAGGSSLRFYGCDVEYTLDKVSN